MKSKRGTYLIEAAVVLPIVILTVITVVLIVMYFYDCSVQQSNLHRALRYEASSVSGKTVYYFDAHEHSDAGIYFTHERKHLSASTHVTMIHRGILRRRGQKEIKGSIHLYDAAKYVLRRQNVEAFLERKQ